MDEHTQTQLVHFIVHTISGDPIYSFCFRRTRICIRIDIVRVTGYECVYVHKTFTFTDLMHSK